MRWLAHKEPSHLDFQCLQMYVRIYLISEVTWFNLTSNGMRKPTMQLCITRRLSRLRVFWLHEKALVLSCHPIVIVRLYFINNCEEKKIGAQWLSGRVLDSRPRGHGFEPHRRHCVVVLEQDTFILA